MKEVPVQFGKSSSLLGIVSEPDEAARAVCCILITAGLTLRMGPFRLYTAMARTLAKAGVTTLRFDLDSIGDSGACYSAYPLNQRTMLEIRDVVDFMQARYGIGIVVVCGLCSGAEAAFRYAEQDQRVMGVAMFDPFSHPAPGNKWRFHVYRIYRRLLRALGLFEPVKYAATGDQAGSGLVQYQYMSYPESHRILSELVERKAYVHFVYTGAIRETFNHPNQLRKVFPDLVQGERIQVDWLPDVNHTPVFARQLEKMTAVVIDKLLAFLDREKL